MRRTETEIRKNLEHAQRWLDRAKKDFNAFRKLVSYDRKTRKAVHCSDPALAVYLLQQSIEKTVKAAAIASGQYKTKDFVGYYRHNSLALILNLIQKIVDRIISLGFGEVADGMGVDLVSSIAKLIDIENQVMDKPSLGLGTGGKKVDFRKESVHISAEVIDKVLDFLMEIRSSLLQAIASAFPYLAEVGIHKGYGKVDNPEAFARGLSDKVAGDLKVRSPTDAQINAGIELNRLLGKYGKQQGGELKRQELIENQLELWAFIALYLLTYITFAHESSSRYPQKPGTTAELGCDDYSYSLGIVDRLGRIGYMTGLTLNEMKPQLKELAFFFAVKPSD